MAALNADQRGDLAGAVRASEELEAIRGLVAK
jgi:hypothetical protein